MTGDGVQVRSTVGGARTGPWSQLALIALTQVLALAVWFSASAVLPVLRRDWELGTAGGVGLTVAVQLGFVVGALVSATTGLADRVRPERLLATGAGAAAACTLGVAVLADGPLLGVALRFLTGMGLALVYPIGMKLMASWFGARGRGLALGVLVGALTLGSLLPQLLVGVLGDSWRTVLVAAAASGAGAALLALGLLRAGPHLSVGSRPRAAQAFDGFRSARPRLVNLAYLGHMWELYALWTWAAVWITASRDVHDPALPAARIALLALVAFGICGAAGCVLAGWLAGRWGRAPVATVAVSTSGVCCLLSPWAWSWPTAVLAVFVCVWGASVIADSAMFSTLLSEVSDRRWVGTALTVQTATGFLLTTVTISALPYLADLVTWRWTLVLLAAGPVVSVAALARFRALDRGPRAAAG
ncbi:MULTISPECIES: MFS transporter [unclassified Modestobacter]|uniref:MFS transporter n=1 Tax=unclassified Modestobacter TaxID=2643866 RepID=UPI0022AA512D|nr:MULTISPECIES: MFS transporter [unclassified Modestobacter]MCZ2825505.1 MFS transporter [Modestobacter sp. VKM Ac-2981]MCZ2853430.1 MFS transporter [Modestobacter sp. VKM Ac-2982]